MLKNYFRVAYRNLLKHKGYTLINITGLAIGVACCLLIIIYILNEISYDDFHARADRIYRVKQISKGADRYEEGATTPFLIGPTLKAEYPRLVDHTVRFYDMQEESQTFRNKAEGLSFREENFYFVDSTFFDVFSVKLVRGNPDKALTNQFSLVLTQEKAKIYFGDEDPIGKILNFKGIRDVTVTGVMQSIPKTSHIKADMLLSFTSIDDIFHRNPEYDQSWYWNPIWTYVQLKKGVSAGELEAQFPSFVDKYYKAGVPQGETFELELQPITDIHLYSHLDAEMQPNNSIFYIYLFSAVAVLILIIACINFVNLSTARSIKRSREVGIRKVLGGNRKQLFRQFMGESFLMSFIAVVLAVFFVEWTLLFYNDVIDKQLVFNPLQNGEIILGLITLIFVVGLLAGIYPALYLSGFHPTEILKGKPIKGKKGVLLRKGLVVFQFTLSVVLIIGTIIIYLQLQHMRNKKLGFDKEQIVILPIKQNLIAWEFPTFKEQVLQNPNILSVTGIQKILGSEEQTFYRYAPTGTSQGEQSSILALYVTHDFVKTFDIEVLAGRSFSRGYPTDKDQSILINKQMLSMLDAETPSEAIGKVVYYYPSNGERRPYTVVGVLNDFNYTSIKKQIDPLVIRLVQGLRPILGSIEYAAVEIAPGGVSAALSHIRTVWKKVNHIDPFEYSFQDEELDKIYSSETKMGKVVSAFSVLCILIACLGLFGLASYTSSKRTKEIGIRKTMGATVNEIIFLLSKEYFKLMLLANIIAWPVIYFLVNQWLQDFPDHISLTWNLVVVFVVTVVVSLFICLITVSYQSLKAALINPAETIRDE